MASNKWFSKTGVVTVTLFAMCTWVMSSSEGFTQTTDITSSGLNTVVADPISLPSGQTVYDITGGTRPGGGSNLFHSFGEFSVGAGDTANFLNDARLPTTNILARVTDGNPSSIFGTLQTTGFGNANLFLLNPYGVLFGPDASVNIGGSMHVSTADYLKLTDGARFTAIPGPQDALLSMAPVAAFGFVGPGSPSAIAVHGSLAVKNGRTLSLIGGNSTFADPENPGTMVAPGVTLDGGNISAPGGQINLIRVEQPVDAAIPGEVTLNGPGQPVGVTHTGLTNVASLIVSKGTQGTTINMSGAGPSAVKIRGGQLVMTDWQMEVHRPLAGEPAGIDIVLQTSAKLSGSSFSTRGHPLSAGPITITSPDLSLTNSRITTTAGSPAAIGPGDITLNVRRLTMQDSSIAVAVGFCCGSLLGSPLTIQGLNGAGTKADVVLMSGGRITGGGFGGSVSISARNVEMNDGAVLLGRTAEGNPGASISLTVDSLKMRDGSMIETGAESMSNKTAPPVTIIANNSVQLIDSTIFTSSRGSGAGGDITISSKTLSLSDGAIIESKTIGSGFNSGRNPAGNIILNVEQLTLTNGSQVDSGNGGNPSAFTTGSGGQITVQGRGGLGTRAVSVTISGTESGLFSEAHSRGPAGTITVNANTVNISNGATLSASTFGEDVAATGGEVTINAKNLTLANASITAASTGAADAGSVQLSAQNNLLVNQGIISTKSLGIGAAGSIVLDAGNNLVLNKSTVTAENLGTGPVGSILLRSGNLILLNNSTVKPFPLIDLY